MTTLNVRLYESDEAAKATADRLTAAGYPNNMVLNPSDAAGREPDAVEAAVRQGFLPARQAAVCVRGLQQGRSVVAAKAPFGRGQDVLNIMEGAGAVDSDVLRRYVPGNPSPLSDALGLPTLSRVKPVTNLARSSWSFSSMFGLSLLSKSAAPLSSMIGFKPVLERKKNWTSSMGLPLLSRNAAPLSSVFGAQTVYSPKRPWQWSWGMPMLTDNPAPLSSLFGIPTLTRKR